MAGTRRGYVEAVSDFLLQAADDELTIGHRDSEWLGLAPEIEEDVAFGSISQDEVGHAVFYFGLLSDLGAGLSEQMAFERPAAARRNAVLLERDNGDWAYTMVRHYFYDEFDHLRLESLTDSSYLPLRRGAVKMLREEYYHRMHAQTWFTRLALAGGEAKERVQRAVFAQWPDLADLFAPIDDEAVLLSHGIVSASSEELKTQWLDVVTATMSSVGLVVPAESTELRQDATEGRRAHTTALEELLVTMAEVYDLDRQAAW